MLRVALIPRGVINHGEDKPSCIQSERYPIRGGLAEKQRLAQDLFCIWMYSRTITLSLACKSVVSRSIKPCLHTQLPEHNKSYRIVSGGWGHLITWNGPMMGHLNSFSASGGGNLNKNFAKNTNARGLPGGGMLKLRFDWYINWNKYRIRFIIRITIPYIWRFLFNILGPFVPNNPNHTWLKDCERLSWIFGVGAVTQATLFRGNPFDV